MLHRSHLTLSRSGLVALISITFLLWIFQVELPYCFMTHCSQSPGLIVSVEDGRDEGDIKKVENLVASYISKPSCLILLVVACESPYAPRRTLLGSYVSYSGS